VSQRFIRDFQNVYSSFAVDFEIDTYLVESDSSDTTPEVLMRTQATYPDFSFLSLGTLRTTIPDRVERIRFCRNVYVRFIVENFNLRRWDYVVVADLDGMNGALNLGSVRSCFSNLDWDCCLSNQTGGYYDIYALRHRTWQPGNCFVELEKLRAKYQNHQKSRSNLVNKLYSTLSDDFAKKKAIYAQMWRIPKQSPWMEVDSGFGGLAIYKTSVFMKFDYSKIDKGSRDSEHVDLHRKMRAENNKIFINPRFINARWNTYNINRFFLIRQVRRMVWNSSIAYKYSKMIKDLVLRQRG
jgi:hypothetical protein